MNTDKKEFISRLDSQPIIPVVREIFYDFETPVGLYQRIASHRQGSFLLESAIEGIWSDWSFIGLDTFGALTGKGEKAEWVAQSLSEHDVFGPQGIDNQNPVEALAILYNRWAGVPDDHLPPLNGGLVGFLGWESIHLLEDVPRPEDIFPKLPDIYFNFVSDLVAINHSTGTLSLITNHIVNKEESVDEAWEASQKRLDELLSILETVQNPSFHSLTINDAFVPQSNMTEAEFEQKVDETIHRIQQGEALQVVLSQRFEQEFDADPLDVYRILRATNPSPYMYIMNCRDLEGEDFHIVGSSPEALIKVQDRKIITHPIAGSRPRGATYQEDQEIEADLLADKKELSEHVMLVELSKADLSKVCDEETIEVPDYMQILRYSHVMHIGSTVTGILREDESPVTALYATFPAGTLSGAPKPVALSIIAEKEETTRGVYGGVVGYFSLSGDADLAIAIRTALIYQGKSFVQAGAGIVADSDALMEYQETVNKSMAPQRAVFSAKNLKAV